VSFTPAEPLAYLQNGNMAEARSTLQQVLKLKPSAEDADNARRVLATTGVKRR
jgi:hypothetical protein